MSTLFIRNRLFERWWTSDGGDARGSPLRKLHESISASQHSPLSTQAPHTVSLSHSLLSKSQFQPQQQESVKRSLKFSAMADQELSSILKQLHQSLSSRDYSQAPSLLSRAKICLLNLNVLIPSSQTQQHLLLAARETLELGALISIRLQDPEAFTRYFQQLKPFYNLPADILPKEGGNTSKVTGLYLLLQLSQGDYAGFHTTLEALETQAQQNEAQDSRGKMVNSRGTSKGLEEDAFVQYPIRLEQALMEGSYDRVWGETKSERVPSEEFAIFSDVCLTVRHLSI